MSMYGTDPGDYGARSDATQRGEAERNTKASVSSTSITADKEKSPASDAIGKELIA